MNKRDIRENIICIGITTVIIIVSMILLPKFILEDNVKLDNTKSEGQTKKSTSKYIQVKGKDEVRVYRSKSGKVEKLKIDDYIIGVVSGEMPIKFEKEALKAQAIAARTYYFSKRNEVCEKASGADICDTIHCQVYMNKEERKATWDKKEVNSNYKKIETAVKETEGLVLTYENEIIKYPQFFSTSWGKTENSEDVFVSAVPYLKSTESPGEDVSPSYLEKKKYTYGQLASILNNNFQAGLTVSNIKSKIEILERTEGGGVKNIKLGEKQVKGTDFRKALDLNSTNFNLEYGSDYIEVVSKGNGHGVGMSQWGANLMAKDGKKCEDILKHYYKGIEIKKIKLNK